MKKIKFFPLFMLLIFGGLSKAQTGTLTGKGMGICQDYHFDICPGQVITPLNYITQGYVCDNGNRHISVSFTIMGASWRVEELSWNFVATGTTATVSGTDPSGNPVSYTFNPGDVLTPFAYTTISGIDYVEFYINGAAIGGGFIVEKANFQIDLTPVSPYFMLGATPAGLQGTSSVTGTHYWEVYSVEGCCKTDERTLIGTFETQSFSIESGGPCYYVIHKMTTDCGEICAAQCICASSCEEDPGKNVTLGVKAQQKDDARITVYPNPARGSISIDVAKINTDFSLDIMDLTGKTVKTFKIVKANDKGSTVKWNAESLPAGEYLIRVVTTDNQVFTRKFIRE